MTTTTALEVEPNVVVASADQVEADKRRDRIRRNAETLVGDLVVAWRSRDWLRYGLPSWEAYVDSVTPDGMTVRLDAELLVDRIVDLTNEGMTVRAIGPVVGISKSKVANLLREPDVAARVTRTDREGLDGRTQVAARTKRAPAPAPASVTVTQAPAGSAPSTVDQVVDVIAKAGRNGLTVVEVGAALDWHHGQTSAALSKAERRGRLMRVQVPGERYGRYSRP